MSHSYLALIPARGGSQRLPNKNILDFCGKPLIKWTIDAALKCKKIDKVVVSSDSEKILKISSVLGVDILKRSKELSNNKAKMADVVLDVLSKSKYGRYKNIVLLQPTCPLRDEHQILKSIELMENKNASGIISVSKSTEYPSAYEYITRKS